MKDKKVVIVQNYRRAPHFEEVAAQSELPYRQQYNHLS